MASSVSFRTQHMTQLESVFFPGNSIRVLDLKKEVLERKNMTGGLDFDLQIKDDTGKIWSDDNELIPKNSILIVKRIPVTKESNSLFSKIRGSQVYDCFFIFRYIYLHVILCLGVIYFYLSKMTQLPKSLSLLSLKTVCNQSWRKNS